MGTRTHIMLNVFWWAVWWRSELGGRTAITTEYFTPGGASLASLWAWLSQGFSVLGPHLHLVFIWETRSTCLKVLRKGLFYPSGGRSGNCHLLAYWLLPSKAEGRSLSSPCRAENGHESVPVSLILSPPFSISLVLMTPPWVICWSGTRYE